MAESTTFTQDQYKEIWDMIFTQTGYPKNHPKHGTTPTDQPKEDAFVWTDELVCEFAVDNKLLKIMMSDFKKSKQTTTPIQPSTDTVDWEVISYKDNYAYTDIPHWEIITKEYIKWKHASGGLYTSRYSIHSVLRKSDNTLFCVGDEVKVTGEPNGDDSIPKDWGGKITEFWITSNGDMYICCNGHYYGIKYFKKLPTQV